MASFSIHVSNYLRTNGTHQVKIILFHEGGRGYIDTPYYVATKDVRRSKGKLTNKIKDEGLNARLSGLIKSYTDDIISMGEAIYELTAQRLADRLTQKRKSHASKRTGIDFIKFGDGHIDDLKSQGRGPYAGSFSNTINSLRDFSGNNLLISDITVPFLDEYERYLKTERIVKRPDKYGEIHDRTLKPMKQSGASVYLRNIRTLFNAAKRKYNNQTTGEILIPHYPFEVFQIKKGPAPKKRSLDITTVAAIQNLRESNYHGTHHLNRVALSRDVFMLSFYLVGMNPIDLFTVDTIRKGRIEYNRKKTRARRSDEAFISIRIEREAMPLIEKYKDPSGERIFNFYKSYSNIDNFTRALNEGLAHISKDLNLDRKITMYYARHSWSTIARNKCKVSKDDIHEALNHVDPDKKITDVYIEKDWSNIDRANRKVLNYLAQSKHG